MRRLNLGAVLALLACFGCEGRPSTQPPSPALPVQGRVFFRGKPLTQGRITFEPTDGGRDATGTIKPDGSFVLSTFGQDDGALPGVHTVKITELDRPLATRGETHVRVVEGKADYVLELK